jgi:hypothetical protein
VKWKVTSPSTSMVGSRNNKPKHTRNVRPKVGS